MLKPFFRSSSSDKHSKTLQIDHRNSFNMTIADMDVGVFPPLHNKIVQKFSSSFNESKTPEQHSATTQKYKQSRKGAAKSIIDWYNTQYKCQFKYINNDISTSDQELKNNPTEIQINNQINVGIHFAPSAVSLCSYSILSSTSRGDQVLIFTPVYSTYKSLILSLQRQVVALQLKQQIIYSSKYNAMLTQFSIDFSIFQKLLQEGVKAVLLSHPHNPGGRVWTHNQLSNIVSLCKTYNVCIVSDQILSDLYLQQHLHQFHTLGRELKNFSRIIVINSISKSFNYSSIQGGYAIASDPQLLLNLKSIIEQRYEETIDLLAFSSISCCLGFEGKAWLSIIKEMIENNFRKMVKFQQQKAKQLRIGKLQSAYLVFVDFSFYFESLEDLVRACKKYNLSFTTLEDYYMKQKKGIRKVRICIACQQDHFDRFLVNLEKIVNESVGEKILMKPKL